MLEVAILQNELACFFFQILQLLEQLFILHPLLVVLLLETIQCAIRWCHDSSSSPFFAIAVLRIQLWSETWHLCCPVCFSVCVVLSSLSLVAEIMSSSKHVRLDIYRFVEVSALSMLVLVVREFQTASQDIVDHAWLLKLLLCHLFTDHQRIEQFAILVFISCIWSSHHMCLLVGLCAPLICYGQGYIFVSKVTTFGRLREQIQVLKSLCGLAIGLLNLLDSIII